MNIGANVSSIGAHQTFMNNNAQNVANVNSDGYIPKSTTLNESANGGVAASTTQVTDNGSTTSQTDLAKEMSDQVVISRGVEANVAAIRTQDEMIGSLLDIKI